MVLYSSMEEAKEGCVYDNIHEAGLINHILVVSVGGDHWSPGKAGSHRSPPYAMTSSQDWSGQGPEHG